LSSDKIDIRYVAKLARIALTDDEVERFGAQLRDLLEHVDAISALDTASIPATAQVVESRKVERADVVAAVTGHDEDNLIIAQVAKSRFNVPRTVARINNPRNEFIFTELGIDATVSATQIILSVIQQEIPEHPLVHLRTLQEGGVEILQLQLTEDSPAIGKSLGELNLPEDTAIPLLMRRGKPVVVHADTVFESEDKLIAIAAAPQESVLRDFMLGAK